MNKKYTAVLIQNNNYTGWTVRCEHIDDDFRMETIARCNHGAAGCVWAIRIATALNQQETTIRVNAEHSSAMTWLTQGDKTV